MIENSSPGKYNVSKPGKEDGESEKLNSGLNAKEESIELLETPTYFNILNKGEPIKVSLDGKCQIRLESNITDRSFTANRCYIEIDKGTESKIDSQITSLKSGKATASLLFKSVAVGEKIPIRFFLKSGNHKINLRTEKRYIEIVEKKNKSPRGSISIDAPYPIEVYKDGKNKVKYKEYGWDKNEEISKVERGRDISIYVNMSHSKFQEFLGNVKPKKLDSLKSDYFLGVAYASFLQNEDEIFKNFNESENDKSEEIKDRSLLIAAQTLLQNFKKQIKD